MTFEIVSMDEMAERIMFQIHEIGNESTRETGSFILGLSGGSLLNLLSTVKIQDFQSTQYGKKIDNNNKERNGEYSRQYNLWNVFMVDERHVPLDSPDSNFGSAVKLLPFLNQCQMHHINDRLDLKESALDYNQKLKETLDKYNKTGFDLIILGIGPDGHTASLFPNNPKMDTILNDNDQYYISVEGAPKPPPNRISLTMKTINQSKTIWVYASGFGKNEITKKGYKKSGDLPICKVDKKAHWWIGSDTTLNEIDLN